MADDEGPAALYDACLYGDVEYVEFLLSQGVDPNKTRFNIPPLEAVLDYEPDRPERQNRTPIAKLLLQYGAHVGKVGIGWVWHIAFKYNKRRAVARVLLGIKRYRRTTVLDALDRNVLLCISRYMGIFIPFHVSRAP